MEELLINVNVQGEGDLEKVDKKVEKLGKTANKTQTELQKIRRELRNAKADMLAAEEGTDEYSRALVRASQAQLRLKNTNDAVKFALVDVGETTKNIGGAISGLAGGFTTVIGVMNLFAGENENLARAILTVQSALAVTQGLATFAASLDDMQKLWNSLTTSLQLGNQTISELGEVSVSGCLGR